MNSQTLMNFDKPQIGSPCNGCGLCCRIQVCMNGAFVLGLVDKLGETVPGPCPALINRVDGSFSCGVVLYPKKYLKNRNYPADVLSRNFGNLIGAGTGCDELGLEYTEEEELKLINMINEIKSNEMWVKKSKIALKVVHGIDI